MLSRLVARGTIRRIGRGLYDYPKKSKLVDEFLPPDIDQAAQAGASRQEVLEAVEVGIEMGGGRATVSARFALEVMDRVFEESTRK
jgi:hypothetical protein